METDTAIRLTQREAPWEAGEVLQVTAEQAEKLVRHKVAERVFWDKKAKEWKAKK